MNKLLSIILPSILLFFANQTTFAAQKKVSVLSHGLNAPEFPLPGQVAISNVKRAKEKKGAKSQIGQHKGNVELQSPVDFKPKAHTAEMAIDQDPYLDQRVIAVRAQIELFKAAIDHSKYDADKIVLAQHRLRELMEKLQNFNPQIANDFKKCVDDLEKEHKLKQAINKQVLQSSKEKMIVLSRPIEPINKLSNNAKPIHAKQKNSLSMIDENNENVNQPVHEQDLDLKAQLPPLVLPSHFQHKNRQQLQDSISAMHEQVQAFRSAIEQTPYNHFAILYQQQRMCQLWGNLEKLSPAKAQEFQPYIAGLDKKNEIYTKINKFKLHTKPIFSEKGVHNFPPKKGVPQIDELESHLKKSKQKIKQPNLRNAIDQKHTAENNLKLMQLPSEIADFHAPNAQIKLGTIQEVNESLNFPKKTKNSKIAIGNLFHRGKPEDLFNLIEIRLKRKNLEFIKKRALRITADTIQGNDLEKDFVKELKQLFNALDVLEGFNASNKALAEKIEKLKQEIKFKIDDIDTQSYEQYLDYFERQFKVIQSEIARCDAMPSNDIQRFKIYHALRIRQLKAKFLFRPDEEKLKVKFNELAISMDLALKPLILIAKKVAAEAFVRLEKIMNAKEPQFQELNHEIELLNKHLADLAALDSVEADLLIKNRATLFKKIEQELDKIFKKFEQDYKVLCKENDRYYNPARSRYKENIKLKIILLKIIDPLKAQKYEQSFTIQCDIIYLIIELETHYAQSILINSLEQLKLQIDKLKALNFHTVDSYEKQFTQYKKREDAKVTVKKKEVQDKIRTHTQLFEEGLKRFKTEPSLGAAWIIKKEMQKNLEELNTYRILDWQYIEPSSTIFEIIYKKMQKQFEECTLHSKAPLVAPNVINTYINVLDTLTSNWDRCFKEYGVHCQITTLQSWDKTVSKALGQYEHEQRQEIQRLTQAFREHNVELGDRFNKEILEFFNSQIAPLQLVWKKYIAEGAARLQKVLKELHTTPAVSLDFYYFELHVQNLAKLFFLNIAQLKAALNRKKLEAKMNAHVAKIEAQLASAQPDVKIIWEHLKALWDYKAAQNVDDPEIRYVEKMIADISKKIIGAQKHYGANPDQTHMQELFEDLKLMLAEDTQQPQDPSDSPLKKAKINFIDAYLKTIAYLYDSQKAGYDYLVTSQAIVEYLKCRKTLEEMSHARTALTQRKKRLNNLLDKIFDHIIAFIQKVFDLGNRSLLHVSHEKIEGFFCSEHDFFQTDRSPFKVKNHGWRSSKKVLEVLSHLIRKNEFFCEAALLAPYRTQEIEQLKNGLERLLLSFEQLFIKLEKKVCENSVFDASTLEKWAQVTRRVFAQIQLFTGFDAIKTLFTPCLKELLTRIEHIKERIIDTIDKKLAMQVTKIKEEAQETALRAASFNELENSSQTRKQDVQKTEAAHKKDAQAGEDHLVKNQAQNNLMPNASQLAGHIDCIPHLDKPMADEDDNIIATLNRIGENRHANQILAEEVERHIDELNELISPQEAHRKGYLESISYRKDMQKQIIMIDKALDDLALNIDCPAEMVIALRKKAQKVVDLAKAVLNRKKTVQGKK